MKRLAHFNREDGAAAVIVVLLFAFVLFGLAALVVDVGSMYTTKRDAQNMADAAALAGVQDLPFGPGAASTAATYYMNLNKNHDFAIDPEIEIYATNAANDTITVKVYPNAPAFFARTWGITAMQVNAKATAMVGSPGGYNGVMPFGIMSAEPSGTAAFGYAFNQQVTLKQPAASGEAGNFQFLSLTDPPGGHIGNNVITEALKTGGVDVPVYIGEEYNTKTGINGQTVWKSLKILIGTDDCTVSEVAELQDDGTVVINDYDCPRLIVCPIIEIPGPPVSYNWNDLNGSSLIRVIGFSFFFIDEIDYDKSTGNECLVTGRFVRPVLDSDFDALDWGPIDPYGGIGFRLVD